MHNPDDKPSNCFILLTFSNFFNLHALCGATLKHKCGKRIVTLSLLSFSLIFFFWGSFFFYGLSLFFVRCVIPTCGGIIVSIILFLTWDNALIMMIITLLFTYNSRITTQCLEQQYDSMWMPPVAYRDVQWIKSDMYKNMMNGGFATNTMSTTLSCKAIWQWWSMW